MRTFICIFKLHKQIYGTKCESFEGLSVYDLIKMYLFHMKLLLWFCYGVFFSSLSILCQIIFSIWKLQLLCSTVSDTGLEWQSGVNYDRMGEISFKCNCFWFLLHKQKQVIWLSSSLSLINGRIFFFLSLAILLIFMTFISMKPSRLGAARLGL